MCVCMCHAREGSLMTLPVEIYMSLTLCCTCIGNHVLVLTPLTSLLVSSLPFLCLPRKRMQISESESFYLLVNRKALMSTSLTILEVYRSQRDDDGFLYMTYASQEMFG